MADGAGDVSSGKTPGGGWVPIPDPTVLTTEAVNRATEIFRRELEALRELLNVRLATMDVDRDRIRASIDDVIRRFSEAIEQFRDEVERRDHANRELIEQRLTDLDDARTTGYNDLARRFVAEREYIAAQINTVNLVVNEKFSAVDGRFEESKVAVDAAFAAAKEAVAEQNKSNAREIGKSETATKEQLASLSRVTDAGIAGLSDKISDARDRITSIESLTRGIEQAGGVGRQDRGLRNSNVVVALMSATMLISLVAIVITVVLHK